MAIYTVHLPPLEDASERILKAKLVPDGFSRWAMAFGGFWLVSKRLWISAFLFTGLVFSIWAVSYSAGLPLRVPAFLSLLLFLLLALEGSSLQRWRLKRRGWSEVGVISAPTQEEAERRFFEANPPALPASAPPSSKNAVPAQPQPSDRSVLGLFPEPGARA
jgi:Protein of unknown function (DUF2628)